MCFVNEALFSINTTFLKFCKTCAGFYHGCYSNVTNIQIFVGCTDLNSNFYYNNQHIILRL